MSDNTEPPPAGDPERPPAVPPGSDTDEDDLDIPPPPRLVRQNAQYFDGRPCDLYAWNPVTERLAPPPGRPARFDHIFLAEAFEATHPLRAPLCWLRVRAPPSPGLPGLAGESPSAEEIAAWVAARLTPFDEL